MTPRVREILSFYSAESPAVLNKMAQVLNHGLTSGSGRLLLITSEDGVENGPAEAFSYNPDANNPLYHFQLAVRAGASALIAPRGTIEFCARDFAGEIPVFLKINHSVSLSAFHDQLQSSHLDDVHSLGVVGVSFTLALGVEDFSWQTEMLSELISWAKPNGMLVMVQVKRAALPDDEIKQESLPINQAAYVTHLVCQMGAHIVSVPELDPPVAALKDFYVQRQIKVEKLQPRCQHLMQTAFAGQRIVVNQISRDVDFDRHMQEMDEMSAGGMYGFDLGGIAHLKPENVMVKEISEYAKTLIGNFD